MFGPTILLLTFYIWRLHFHESFAEISYWSRRSQLIHGRQLIFDCACSISSGCSLRECLRLHEIVNVSSCFTERISLLLITALSFLLDVSCDVCEDLLKPLWLLYLQAFLLSHKETSSRLEIALSMEFTDDMRRLDNANVVSQPRISYALLCTHE